MHRMTRTLDGFCDHLGALLTANLSKVIHAQIHGKGFMSLVL